MRLPLALLLPVAAIGQILMQSADRRFPGRMERPVSMAGSPFEVWVAYPGALATIPRLGPAQPRWFGTEQGLPSEGIASICFDDATQSLWIRSMAGRSFRWSQGLESAREESPPAAGCSSQIGRPVQTSDLPPLFPSSTGWLQSGSDLVSPEGFRQHMRLGLVLEGRDLWIATDFGVWTGNASSGRIEPIGMGLPEACIRSLLRDSSGQTWLLGCRGSLSLLDASERFKATFLPEDSRFLLLRSPRFLGSAGEDGVWVSVLDGLLRIDPDGIQEAWTGKKAPVGGRVLSCRERQDTLWCGTERSVVRKTSSDRIFHEDSPPWTSASPAHILASTPCGLVAATTRGFWWHGPRGWARPGFLSTDSAPVRLMAVEPVEPHRIAWTSGAVLHIDTIPGHPARVKAWILDAAPSSLAFDFSGRVHLALGGGWSIWNASTGEHRDWKSGLGLQGDIDQLVVGADRALLAGREGVVSLPIEPYTPPATSAR